MGKRVDKEVETCLHCKKLIFLKNDNYVLVGTYNRKTKPSDEQFFHFFCWIDYFNLCVLKKAKANVQRMQEMALKIAKSPMIQNALSQIQGGDQILSMLNTDLSDTESFMIKKFNKKEDGTKKRGKRKSQMQKL